MAQTKEEKAAYQAAYYAANAEEIKARSAAWYAANVTIAKEYAVAYSATNAEKKRARTRAWAAANPDKKKCARLRKAFGITLAEHAQMIEDQQGLCLICAGAFDDMPPKHIHVDHCHETGKVRGVLCHYCNIGIGNLKDSPALLRAAADYLERG